ncbi:MAG: hypothetical protein DWQ02_19400 [Bacteroidetes bacterium]|nr:MAG: hypothetical protein DWQ02_19400 [Bacteroidota bacterium]
MFIKGGRAIAKPSAQLAGKLRDVYIFFENKLLFSNSIPSGSGKVGQLDNWINEFSHQFFHFIPRHFVYGIVNVLPHEME